MWGKIELVQSRATIRFFGKFRVELADGTTIDAFDTQRAAKLLALVALSRRRSMLRSEISDLLWPDDFPDATRLRLRQELSRLRRALGEWVDLLAVDAQTVSLNQEMVVTELELLERGISRPDVLGNALRGTDGEFLPGWHDDWVYGERKQAHALANRAAATRGEQLLAEGNAVAALDIVRSAIERDPCDEPLRRSAIQAHAQLGSLTLALTEFQNLKRNLRERESRDPSEETAELMANLSQGPATAPAKTEPSGLLWKGPPHPVDTFFGRQRELVQLREFFEDSAARLLTIVGTGGMGKTRLLAEALHRLPERFQGQILYVPLAEHSHCDNLAEQILFQLEHRGGDTRSAIKALAAVLPDSPVLIALDNLEHLLPAILADLHDILAQCPQVKIVTTSRVPTEIRGERVLRLNPLDVQSDARAMLIDHWRALRPDVRLTPENEKGLEALLEFLDGVPLAIRLAAARLKVLTPADVRKRLEAGQERLVSTAPDLPERHHDLTRLIESSLLDRAEPLREAVFVVSLFRGGCTLDQASELLGPSACEMLEQLVDASLVTLREDDELRFSTLELVRQTVRHLPSEESIDRLEQAFLESMAQTFAAYEIGFMQPVSLQTLSNADAEIDNALAAFQLAKTKVRTRAVHLLELVWRYLLARGRYHLCTELIDATADWPEAKSAALFIARASLAGARSDEAVTSALLRSAAESYVAEGQKVAALVTSVTDTLVRRKLDSLATCVQRAEELLIQIEAMGNSFATGMACGVVAILQMFANQRARSGELYRRAFEIFSDHDDDLLRLSAGLRYASHLFGAGQHDASIQLLDRLSSPVFELGDPTLVAFLSETEGRNYLELGKPSEAESSFRRALHEWKVLDNEFQEADQRLSIARALLDQDRIEEASQELDQSARLWYKVSDFGGLCQSMTSLARILLVRGSVEEARAVLCEALTLERDCELTLVQEEQLYRERISKEVGGTIAALGETTNPDRALRLFDLLKPSSQWR